MCKPCPRTPVNYVSGLYTPRGRGDLRPPSPPGVLVISVVTPPLARAVSRSDQEWRTPHTLTRFGPIYS